MNAGDVDARARVYLDDRKLLNEMEREAANNFDRSMITLSAGALLVSLNLINGTMTTSSHSAALHCAWFCFTVATISTLLSMFSARQAAEQQRGILDKDYVALIAETSGYTSPKNKWPPVVDLTNYVSMTSFAIGAIALLSFAMNHI
jgi:hypothetical protein